MTLLMRDQENREEGLKEGDRGARMEIVKAMLADGMNCETVAKYTGVPLEDVEALAQLQPA